MSNVATIRDENNATRFPSYNIADDAGWNAVLPAGATYRVGRIEMEDGKSPRYYVSVWTGTSDHDELNEQIGFL